MTVSKSTAELARDERDLPHFDPAWRAMLEAIPDPVFIKDRRHRWVLFNDAFAELLGRPREWMQGRSDFDSSPADEARVFWAKDDEVFETGRANTNLEAHTDTNGRRRVIETKKTLFIGPDGQAYLVGVIRDLTDAVRTQAELERANGELRRLVAEREAELKVSHAQLESFAYYDPLTGLPNRRLLFGKLEKRLQQGALVAFLVDIDNFKWLNDSKGQSFGDEVLRALADRLRATVEHALIARMSADEFIVVLAEPEHRDEAWAAGMAENLLATCSQPVQVHGEEIAVSVSIGVAMAPRDADNAAQLIQRADTAMHKAKDRGRNQYAFFDPKYGNRADEFVALETGLRAALRGHALGVALQPIVSARTRQVLGYEALARWHDARLGEVSPARFVPMAENTGMVHELGMQVLRKATLSAKRLPPDSRLAVNLSVRQLTRASLLTDVTTVLKETGFDPRRLEFEITESFAANISARALNAIDGLRQIGVSFALDDFGTGYSALVQLQRLPIDRIKIDRGFVAELPGDPRSAALVEAMVRMAHALNLRVVAEGVEREEQWAFLSALGVDEVQGFLFARPQPAP